METAGEEHRVLIGVDNGRRLGGTLAVPDGAAGVVLFAHGSGSSQFSPRNRAVARAPGKDGPPSRHFGTKTSPAAESCRIQPSCPFRKWSMKKFSPWVMHQIRSQWL